MQNAWKVTVLSELKDSQTWEVIKDLPIQEKVSQVVALFGKMYQQPNNPYEFLGEFAGQMSNCISSLDLSKLEKAQGKKFFIAVIDLIQDLFEKAITTEFDSVKKELK